MFEFLSKLFDTSDFPPRWTCGNWTTAHGWLHILSDLGVWSAYLAIPCVLGYFVLRRKDIPFRTIFLLFGAFILACGTTHLMEVLMFWWPAYRLAGIVKLFTALVSWGTVLALVPVTPKALAMRTPDELEREIAARQQAEDALQRVNTELEERVQVRTAELAKANATLRYEREMLRITLASIGDAVITTDFEGRVTFLNSVAQTLTGWNSNDSQCQPLGSVFRIVNEQTRKTVENPALRALKEGTIVGLANHTLLIAKDGTERAIDDSAAPIRDGEGNLAGAVLVFRDVTEQRKAERSARFLASIVESSDDAIIGKDVNGIITSWNKGAERIFGYSAAEAVGRPIAMLAPWVHADEMPDILARIRRDERVDHFDTVRRAKDGRLVPISLTVSPIKDEDGNIIGASKIARDISERKRAEESLHGEKARLHATLTGIGDAVIVTDTESRITMMNPVAEALTGWKEESVGRPLEEVFRILNEQTRRTVDSPVSRVMREGTVVGLANHTLLVAKDGSEIPIDDSAAPIKDTQGRLTGVVLVFRDVTERRRAEETLLQADRRKDEFLATLAHELRNPLAPIRNSIELLRRAHGNADLIGQASRIMERQVGLMVRLVDDLLDISRITQGKVQLRKERVELAAVVQSPVEECRPLIEGQSHELTVSLPPDPIYLEADPTRLGQAFANLLRNAAKYTDKGGRIWLTAERQGGEVAVSVRDTGIGIAAEHLSHIFEMFSQVTPALDRTQGGLGIGLALVKGLVKLHGGSVEARSSGIGLGSEFTVRLPTVEAPVRASSKPEDKGEKFPSRKKCRVLIADDLQDSVESLAIMLQMAGHDIQTAHDGLAAVQAAATFRPDVALLDIGMPKMNGYQAARHIREQEWGKNMVLVALTGWGQEEDKRRATEAGFDHHLTKPVAPSALEKLLAVFSRAFHS
jgi:PAS domain S-box-containing protein